MKQINIPEAKSETLLKEGIQYNKWFIQTIRNTTALYQWKDVNSSDIKIFMAHIIVMSLVRKSVVHSNWSRNSLSHMPFFGKYLSRNKFQNILWHLHLNNIADNPPPGCPGHDPLAWLRNIITMAQDNFERFYIPGIDVAVNKSTCAFRGRVKFLQYNKSKPNTFHIKLFMASEKYMGYILSFFGLHRIRVQQTCKKKCYT